MQLYELQELWTNRSNHRSYFFVLGMMVELLPDPFQRLGRGELHVDPTVGLQTKSGPEIKDASSAKKGAPKRLRIRCETIEKVLKASEDIGLEHIAFSS